MLDQAKKLYDLGWNVIPVQHRSKASLVPWKEWQTVRVPYEKLTEWFGTGETGIGVVCGQVSGGLAVLDFDSFEAFGRWSKANPKTSTSIPLARSGRGFHAVFRSESLLPSGQFRIKGETEPSGDILSDRKLCVLPPTIHPSTGAPRVWVSEPDGTLPTLTLEELGVEPVRPEKPSITVTQTVPVQEGQRHGFLVSMAGRLRNLGMGNWSLEASLLSVNKERCQPPLDDGEVKDIAVWASSLDVHSLKGIGSEEQRREGPMLVPHDCFPIGSEQEPSRFEGMFLSLSEYLTETRAAEVEWLLEGLLPVGYLVILGGTSKAGKTCLLTNLALCVAEGREFLGLPVTQSPVLWVALEETEAERRIAIEAYDGEPDDLYTTHEKVYIDRAEGIEALRYWIRKTGARLLVIDPLYGAHRAESLSDGSAARRVLQPLKDLCRTEGVTAVIVHHLTKNTAAGMVRERLADSNQILASASMDVLLDATEMGDGSREIVLHCRGRGDFANQNWVVRSTGMGDYTLLRHGTEVGKGSEATDQTILEALAVSVTATAEQMSQTTGIPLGTVRNRLLDLRKSGAVIIVGKSDRSNVYQAA